MHELSVCLSLLGQLESIARQHGADAITRVELEIGPLSGVEAELLRNAYPIAVAGTLAEHAELVIDEGELIVECTSCGARSPATPNRLVCEACNDYRTRVVSGADMLLKRVELKTPPASSKAAAGS
jgi:hydrogenase nickel incorporation protein HypA/HybF